MAFDGKQLENLVAFIEKQLLPAGFEVKANKCIYNDQGVQIAEFDIEINGKTGSKSITWLIECRDRPSQGPAPGSWIEQLIGRRILFEFDRVTAVSTTSFSPGAILFAQSQGIEIREVRSFAPEEFASWLGIQEFRQVNRTTELKHASILVHESESDERKAALLNVILEAQSGADFLRSSKTGEHVTSSNAFFAAVHEIQGVFDDVFTEQPKTIRLRVDYPSDDYHFTVETSVGSVRVCTIEFFGELRITETIVPIMKTVEYRHTVSGEPISQLAAFAPQNILGINLSMELHHMTESGVTHVTMRRL
ncbi:MAG: hypothetical protein ACXWT1_05915 [Methylobacter sp.]